MSKGSSLRLPSQPATSAGTTTRWTTHCQNAGWSLFTVKPRLQRNENRRTSAKCSARIRTAPAAAWCRSLVSCAEQSKRVVARAPGKNAQACSSVFNIQNKHLASDSAKANPSTNIANSVSLRCGGKLQFLGLWRGKWSSAAKCSWFHPRGVKERGDLQPCEAEASARFYFWPPKSRRLYAGQITFRCRVAFRWEPRNRKE